VELVPHGAERLDDARLSSKRRVYKMFIRPETTPRRNLLATQTDDTVLGTSFREDLLCSQPWPTLQPANRKSVTHMLPVTPHNSTRRNARFDIPMAVAKFEYLTEHFCIEDPRQAGPAAHITAETNWNKGVSENGANEARRIVSFRTIFPNVPIGLQGSRNISMVLRKILIGNNLHIVLSCVNAKRCKRSKTTRRRRS
jgi:hypothetical protein